MNRLKGRMTVALAICAIALTGCLSDEESDTSSQAIEPPTLNSPPTISGSPQAAVTIGSSYSFTPTASDPDGDTLTFSVQNLPTWASFDSSTGRISGQPSLGDVGVFVNIVISVSDGMDSASLSDFEVTVSQVALGSMTLSWTPPTENTDGSALTDLSGYCIYYGISEGNYPNRVEIDTAGISSFVVENLVPDTYYVVATSVNSAGVESSYSNVAIKTVEGG